ncbi:MAG: icfA [Cyanobacteria bacterium RYN_339]|nr:icfA [Cyanobacteria bacterium RYN_339]
MEKLVRGVKAFQDEEFTEYRGLFQQLALVQTPETLFITCSDSRIDPSLITHSKPGDLFIMRNAGNIVPPYGTSGEGEGATIEYAVAALGVKDIVICGHSRCGAMGGLLHPEHLKSLPAVRAWLGHAESTRRIIQKHYSDLTPEQMLTACVEENVLVQLNHLRTHPEVAARLVTGEIRIHGWLYEIESGEVYAYEPKEAQFVPLADATLDPLVDRARQRRAPRHGGTEPLK